METPKLVILDDSEGIGSAFRLMAMDQGFETMAFQNPFEAINWIRRGSTDLLLTDYAMPELDGLGVAAALRSEGWSGDIILMSAVTRSLEPEMMAKLRIREFFEKSGPECQQRLRQWMESRVSEAVVLYEVPLNTANAGFQLSPRYPQARCRERQQSRGGCRVLGCAHHSQPIRSYSDEVQSSQQEHISRASGARVHDAGGKPF